MLAQHLPIQVPSPPGRSLLPLDKVADNAIDAAAVPGVVAVGGGTFVECGHLQLATTLTPAHTFTFEAFGVFLFLCTASVIPPNCSACFFTITSLNYGLRASMAFLAAFVIVCFTNLVTFSMIIHNVWIINRNRMQFSFQLCSSWKLLGFLLL